MFSVIAFVLGNIATLRWPFLPDMPALAMIIPGCAFLLRDPWLRVPASFCLGSLLSIAAVEIERDLRLSGDKWLDESLRGVVTGLPRIEDDRLQFMFTVTEGERQGARLRITWYRTPVVVQPGETWLLNLRVKSPGGSVNFNLFDYEQWLFARRIHGTGYVLSQKPGQLLQAASWPDSLRHRLRVKIAATVPPDAFGTFSALVLGDTSALAREQWEILNRTGTTHLLIVSGLHVGLIAGLTFGAARLAGFSIPVGIALTLLITGGYAAISGWGLPVQRAFVMTAVVLLTLLAKRHMLVSHRFALALVAVTLVDPLASLTSGYWLSFGAVLALLAALDGRAIDNTTRVGRLKTATSAQWVAYLALLPLLGYLHQRLALASIFVNIVAIPWVGMLLVPMLLIGTIVMFVVPFVGEQIMMLAGFLTFVLWRALASISDIRAVLPIAAMSEWQLLAGLCGVVLILLPRGYLPRWPGVVLLALVVGNDVSVEPRQLRMTFFDVGQGLSVLMETFEGALLYDTGPAVGERFSAARQFVLPTLRRRGWSQLETMILSHTHNDHAGGAMHLIERVPVLRQITQQNCSQQWQMGGAQFQTFSVGAAGDSANNHSCLLLIQFEGKSVLLTGDIEASAEVRLIREVLGPIEVMSVPHHGSSSSSSPALLNALRPDMAVNSSGRLNRFEHPDQNVVERYHRRSIRFLDTAKSGAIELEFTRAGITVRTARRAHPALWRSHADQAGDD